MLNGALLEYEMKRKKISATEMARMLGIGRSTFWKKSHGHTEFRQSEIDKIIKILDIQNPIPIFFAD